MTKVSHPNHAPQEKVKIAIPVGHQTSDVLGKQAKVYAETQHVDITKAQQDNHGFQLGGTTEMAPPSSQGPGVIHEQVSPQEQPRVSYGKANDAPTHNAALGNNEPLSVGKSIDRPSSAKVPDPGAV